MNKSLVLQPISIGSVSLPNRIVFPATQTNYANSDGTVSSKLIDFYSNIAEGDCGLIFTGAAVVSADAVMSDRIMTAYSDDAIEGLIKLFSAIESAGSVPAIQLAHCGRQAMSSVVGHDLIAPSAIPCPVMSTLDSTYRIKEMTYEDIVRVEDDFVNAAIRSAKAGVKVVEVNAAHGYLLSGFLSPYSNRRADEYGGSVENRSRIVTEIIRKIRDSLQQQVAISVRVSGNEFVDGGLLPHNFSEIIPLFEDAGMDMLSVSVGTVESVQQLIPDASFGEAPFVSIAETIKQFTNVPVCTVGSIGSLKTAEEVISSNKADFVAMSRAQVADPALVKKSIMGHEDEIIKCIRCNKCMYWNTDDTDMCCALHPEGLLGE